MEQVLQCLNVLAMEDNSVNDLRLAIQHLSKAIISDKEKRFPITRCRGRPMKDIMQPEQLSFLIDQGFNIADMRLLFDCSRRTIEKRIKDYG